jgi:hypothetical protein
MAESRRFSFATTRTQENGVVGFAGAPEGIFPNLDEVKTLENASPVAPPPIPSTLRSPHNPLQPRTGLRFGDPLPLPSPTVTPLVSPSVTPLPSPTVSPLPSPSVTPLASPSVSPLPSPAPLIGWDSFGLPVLENSARPERAGLNLGLSLSYSLMVWTHSGPYIYFDEDNGMVIRWASTLQLQFFRSVGGRCG